MKSVYANVMATCGKDGTCYVKNDGHTPFRGKLEIVATAFADGAERVVKSQQAESLSGLFDLLDCLLPAKYGLRMALAAGPGITEFFKIAMPADPTKEILSAVVTAADGTVESDNVIPLSRPADMVLSKAEVSFTVAAEAGADGSVDIALKTDHVAVFVT